MKVYDEALKYKLAEILGGKDPQEWSRLESLLARGEAGTMYGVLNLPPLGEDEARELMDAASDEMHHDRRIVAHRKRLHECLDNAQERIQWALGEVGTLDELGDPEYMGGHADLEAFLNDAGRALRAAQKIKPTDRDGKA